MLDYKEIMKMIRVQNFGSYDVESSPIYRFGNVIVQNLRKESQFSGSFLLIKLLNGDRPKLSLIKSKMGLNLPSSWYLKENLLTKLQLKSFLSHGTIESLRET
jgi:hypothetical protein